MAGQLRKPVKEAPTESLHAAIPQSLLLQEAPSPTQGGGRGSVEGLGTDGSPVPGPPDAVCVDHGVSFGVNPREGIA